MGQGRPTRILFRDDDRGMFPVFEAIMVALLVLTAILFFTSVQRPTTGNDVGGIDLAQVAADTLQILQVREFDVATGSTPNCCDELTYEEWLENLVSGDSDTATEVSAFLEEVLPTGAKYSLRLDNGVANLTLLPRELHQTPHGARAATVIVLPDWGKYRAEASGSACTAVATPASCTVRVYPGQVLTTADTITYPLVNPGATSYVCFRAPNGERFLRDGPDSGTTNDTWRGHWQSTPNSTTPWKASGLPTGNQQVPTDLLMGTWAVWTSSASCAGTPNAYVNVLPKDCVLDPTAGGCSSPFVAYGLQLVVWYGA